jgi:hypothetical protein
MGSKEIGLRKGTQFKPVGRNRHKEWQKATFERDALIIKREWIFPGNYFCFQEGS